MIRGDHCDGEGAGGNDIGSRVVMVPGENAKGGAEGFAGGRVVEDGRDDIVTLEGGCMSGKGKLALDVARPLNPLGNILLSFALSFVKGLGGPRCLWN